MKISKMGKNLIRPLKVHLLQLVSFKVFMRSRASFVFFYLSEINFDFQTTFNGLP